MRGILRVWETEHFQDGLILMDIFNSVLITSNLITDKIMSIIIRKSHMKET